MTVYVSTKYYGPTNFRGSRIKVTKNGESKFFPYDYASPGDAHESAARSAIEEYWYRGATVTSLKYATETESGRGNVYAIEYAYE